NQELSDFIQKLFSINNIPLHGVTLPCDDFNWLDHGLRSNILGDHRLTEICNRELGKLSGFTLNYFKDVFQCYYVIMRCGGEDEFLLAGPVLFENITGLRFEELFTHLNLPEQLREPLQAYYYGLPVFSDQSSFETLFTLLANYLFGEGQYQVQRSSETGLNDWYQTYNNYLQVPDQPFQGIQYIEERYKVENDLLQAVAKGNENEALTLSVQFSNITLPQRLSNQLRDQKDYTITLNTLLRKSAEQAGVHPIHIDAYSNQNVQQIEAITGLEQINPFRRKIVQGYCRMVNEYNLKGHSLPVQKIINYVSTDLTADLSLKAFASRLNINASYLSSLFKKEMGVPLTEYVNQHRIEHAKRLLLCTDLPTKSVAVQCGVSDMHYFSRLFKQIVGVTPKVFRENTSMADFYQVSTSPPPPGVRPGPAGHWGAAERRGERRCGVLPT
ncbi:MAG: helix-turn-helix domain-containing protein, partial [Clostridiales bacterium]|nr:helix-turn-helix domain-containing protein [Clostridiales bacterium]